MEEIKRLLLELKHRRDWDGAEEVDSVIDRLIELVDCLKDEKEKEP